MPVLELLKGTDLDVGIGGRVTEFLTFRLVVEIEIGQGREERLQQRLYGGRVDSRMVGPVTEFIFMKFSIVHRLPLINFALIEVEGTKPGLPRLLETRHKERRNRFH